MRRRRFISSALSLGAGTAIGSGVAGCSRSTEPQAPVSFVPGSPVPWINWAGNQSCYPKTRVAPGSEDELVDVLRSSRGTVRAVGAGHSFSAVVPTDDTLVSCDLLSGLVSHDPEKLQATLLAGTRLNAMGPLLQGVGQALPNMPDMDYPSLGGSIANSVHATGVEFGSMSDYVRGLTLATPGGELLHCSASENSELFHAARTSVGALGIVTKITLQNQAPFELTEVSKAENMEEVFEDMEARCRQHRHFECFPIPYSPDCITVATDLAQPGDTDSGEDDPQAVNSIRKLFDAVAWAPFIGESLYQRILGLALADAGSTTRTGPSHEVFPHVRVVRFREMEYTVPADAGVSCAREILQTIQRERLPLSFPLEFRYVRGDDIWLSMFEGQDGCSISVHQYGDLDYKAPFAVIEKVFWKYGGRPHWGKLHTLGAAELAALYPRHWQDFQAVRRELDPAGKMLNAHLRQLFVG